MTRQEVIDWIANYLYLNGIGNKAGGRIAAERMVDILTERGVLIPKEDGPWDSITAPNEVRE